MQYIRKLPDAEDLISEYSLTETQRKSRNDRIQLIKKILRRKDNRKLLLVGPCSADREDAVLDYVSRLAKLQDLIKEKYIVIPRVYTSKPRTNGTGYKGMLHHPMVSKDEDDMMNGIISTRRIHLKVIQETGLFSVDEMLYPESVYYIQDLLCYMTVGARSVEDQAHRMTASGVDIPVGMKNPISGDTNALLNSIMAAQSKHSMIYRGWEVRTEGNEFAHAILRGYVDNAGKTHPNYHYENLCEFYDSYLKFNLKNMGVVVDCSHSNSNKRYDEQPRIAKEVIKLCSEHKPINDMVRGIMLESYIEDGRQQIGENIYGKSITDSCLGWKKTEELLMSI